ncbi:MAG: undecaprenyl-diphosphate phosphatase [Candidatus Eisenbacteria bacterium]|nr:undecaprenyl-diphosphate phosphatase [Candidatus Eisenbacteria bacterium]
MTVLEGILLGVLQGLTEFLPVSSSGHLALAQRLLGVTTPGVRFEVLVHLATAVAVVALFRRRVAAVLGALAAWPFRHVRGARRWSAAQAADARLGFHLALGTVPAAVVGYLFESRVEQAFDDVRLVSGLLIVTGFVLWSTRLVTGRGRSAETWRDALVVGVAQAAAVLPGLSRSGATVSAGLLGGLDRRRAAEFSFLLSVPIIVGAAAVNLSDAFRAGAAPPPAEVAGAVVAFVCALPAIAVFVKAISAGRVHRFSYYCWAVGAVGLLLTAMP